MKDNDIYHAADTDGIYTNTNSNTRIEERSSLKNAASKSGGFTLIELLVVIAIIAILIGLLVPVVQATH